MRLTVHLREAKQDSSEVKKNGTTQIVKRTFNTLSFHGVKESDLGTILKGIEDDGLGVVTKHYFSGESIKGHIRKKEKNKK